MNSLKKISFILSLFIFTSCTDNLDFNQLDDYILKPVYTSALTYFTVVPPQFFDAAGVQQFEVSSQAEFGVFENKFFRDNVVKLDFNMEARNEFDKNISVKIEFLDKGNNTVYNFSPIEIESKDLNYIYLEEIDISTNPNVVNTATVKITAEIENTGTPLNQTDDNKFVFKSSATIYIESSLE